jgi:hypothetical protein
MTANSFRRTPVPYISFKPEELDGLLESCIKSAIQKTNELVGKHQWLKNETMPRNTRVGHFTTTLRREMTELIASVSKRFALSNHADLRNFLVKFYDVEMWDDIGIPKLYGKWKITNWRFSYEGWSMNEQKIDDMCKRLATTSNFDDATNDINTSLVNLQRDMYPLQIGIEKLNRLNAESDKIVQNLCAIVEGSM